MSAPNASAWFAWPVMSEWEEVEVEVLLREGITFRVNAADFDYWNRNPRSDMCDDIMAFRIVGLMPMTDAQADELTGSWQKRHFTAPEATYGLASAIEARRAATGNTDAVHESAVPKADAQ